MKKIFRYCLSIYSQDSVLGLGGLGGLGGDYLVDLFVATPFQIGVSDVIVEGVNDVIVEGLVTS